MMQSIERISELLQGARFPVFLTGAGVSTDSGIPDFRSPGTGIWEKVDPMEVATISAFREDPGRFWSFYSERMGMLSSAKPNPAHIALARLEGGGYVKGLITRTSTGFIVWQGHSWLQRCTVQSITPNVWNAAPHIPTICLLLHISEPTRLR